MRRFLGLSLGLCALTLLSGSGDPRFDSMTLAPVMPVGCQGTCNYCLPTPYHKLENTPLMEKVFDVEVSCGQQLPGSCDFYPDCGGFATRDALERLWYTIAQNDEAAVKELMRERPSQIVVIPERSAIQVLNCNGEQVVGQVNVNPRMAKRLNKWALTRPVT
jgi:hypothetical protein